MNLLILDDEIYTVRALQKSVDWKAAGIDTVEIAFNTEKAREIVSQNQVDVLLTDIEMPRESGLEFLEWMKEQGKEYKAICMTCHAEFDYAKKALGLGVMEYLVKPVNREELVNCVKKAVHEIEKERRVRQKSAEGKFWEESRKRVQRDFWQDLVTGALGEEPDRIQKKAERCGIAYDINEQYRMGLFCIRNTNERRQEWKEDAVLMKSIVENIAKDILNGEKELEKAGWKGETMWMLFSEKETEDLYGKIEHFLSELERVMQLNMTAYLSENEFGEELQNVLQRLEEQNEQNVSVEHGIVDEEVRRKSSDEKATYLKKVREMIKKKDFDGLEQLFITYAKGKKYAGQKELFLEGEKVKFELQLFARENQISIEEFWTDELIEKSEGIYRSQNRYLEYALCVLKRTRTLLTEKEQESDLLGEIKKYVQENLENSITREQIAEKVHFSEDYLSKIFKKETGISLNEYITQEKIAYAKKLIEEDKDSIGNIAVRLGYSSFSYFSDIFKRNTGCLPREYRKKSRNTGETEE